MRSGEYDRKLEPHKFHQDATVTGAKRSPSFMIVQTYGRGSLSIDIGSLCFPTMSSISACARRCISDVYVAMSSKNAQCRNLSKKLSAHGHKSHGDANHIISPGV